MHKTLLLIAVVSLFSFNCIAQNKDYTKFWDHLLANDRVEAGKFLNKNKSSDLEWLIINELLRNESGKIKRNDDFLKAFLTKDDFEYYLFAFWDRSFLFDDYIDEGFNSNTFETLDKIKALNLSNIDLKDAITYIDAIRNRHNNNWEAYTTLNEEINAVLWQF
ncbi:hypothetical protein HNV10_13130 [Winogradskyella litoriviva]|uniref:Uncharacterized protein n=1 Tax=Winogradskyella litoriviva TaxID=1220182 RepID=A0ABX2E717_9FLAO|nr:hypothetical protein [Winogradskyella litoriviva]NRD24195.1 hypothetical protein [Winogradskyella litoriviva]